METRILALAREARKPVPQGNFGFGQTFTDHMFTQHYHRETGWTEPTIGPYRTLDLEPASAVLHYGQSIFEGFKAYRRPDGDVQLFRPWENMKRFNRSAARMAMPAVDPEDHLAAVLQLVDLDRAWVPAPPASLYIRPVMIADERALGVHASESYLHIVLLSPVGAYFKEGFQPVPVMISDTYRRAVLGGTGEAKTAGNYAASLFVGAEARRQGYSQVLWLDAIHGRYIEEVGAMNIAFVYADGRIVTPALSGSILPGVTRASLLRLAPHLGYSIEEGQIDVHEMLADVEAGRIREIFGCGTAAVIAPVGRLGYQGRDYVIHNNEPGPITSHLYQALTDIQYGRAADPFEWTLRVTAETS